jgi:hypothetical protein
VVDDNGILVLKYRPACTGTIGNLICERMLFIVVDCDTCMVTFGCLEAAFLGGSG